MKHGPFLALLFLQTALVLTAAQQDPVTAVAPVPVTDAIYFKRGTRLYIQGGSLQADGAPIPKLSSQFFALDLSKSWRADAPAWIRLPDGPIHQSAKVALSMDGNILQYFPTFVNVTGNRYSFDTQTWSTSKSLKTTSAGMWNVHPVMVPPNNRVLLVGGGFAQDNFNVYEWYSITEDRVVERVPLPRFGVNGTNYLPARSEYSAVWSKHLNSVVVYGGTMDLNDGDYEKVSQWVSVFNPSSKKWRLMKTSGVNNQTRLSECALTNDDGTKFFSLGGHASDRLEPSPEFYILDLLTGVWTEGMQCPQRRVGSACTIAGDYLLVWGGAMGFKVVDQGRKSSPVMIYQISQNKWVQEYHPSADYLVSGTPSASSSTIPTSLIPTPTDSASSDPTGNKVNTAAIVGGLVGGISVITLVAFLVWKRRRKEDLGRRQQQDGTGSEIELYDPQRLPQTGNNNSFAIQNSSNGSENPHVKGYGDQDVEIKGGRYW